MQLGGSPTSVINQGQQGALASLTNALNANGQAYTGLENQAQNQYAQNAGAVQAGLANSGLGNTTVAQTMQQAPLNTLNNAMLNIQGQQQGQAANIYGQQGQLQMSAADQLAALLQQQTNATPAPPVVRRGIMPG